MWARIRDSRKSGASYYAKRERQEKTFLFEQFECVHCVKVFPTQEALDNHVHQMHQIRQKDLEICKVQLLSSIPLQ